MKILIVEDEIRVAKLLEKQVRITWEKVLSGLTVTHTIEEARKLIDQQQVDLLFLDLNLNGQDGFDLLKEVTARPFHTIIVSAYRDQALKAFEYGVLDFVPKPFNRERLEKAFRRSIGESTVTMPAAKQLTIKKKGKLLIVPVKDILFIKSDGHYAELHCGNRPKEISDKPLDRLEVLLSNEFFRIHRSYLVSLAQVKEIVRQPGSRYEVLLKDNTTLPLSRAKYKSLLAKLTID